MAVLRNTRIACMCAPTIRIVFVLFALVARNRHAYSLAELITKVLTAGGKENFTCLRIPAHWLIRVRIEKGYATVGEQLCNILARCFIDQDLPLQFD